MTAAIAEFFNTVLSYIFSLVPNLGVSIIILSVIVKAITFPLNNKQIESAKKMQDLQPEIKRIQQKYKNDPEKQNKELMEFMQANKINPLAGCLPLLIQLPILVGIFRMLSQINDFGIVNLPNFSPYLIPSLEFINLLSLSRESPILYAFPIISGLTTFLYSRLTMTDPNQKTLLYLMPALITYLSFNFPAGLVLYWTMNNLLSIGQHYLVSGLKRGKEAPVKAGTEIDGSKVGAKSKEEKNNPKEGKKKEGNKK